MTKQTERMVRHGMIAVAIGASLFLGWFSWTILLHVLTAPPWDGLPDIPLLALVVSAAAVMARAAAGLIASRVWGAYLLAVGAFLTSLPLAFVALLSFVAWDFSQGSDPGFFGRIRWVVAFGLTVGVGVLAVRLGKSMAGETDHPSSEG